MLVKLEVVTAVPWRAKVLAVTVPLIEGSEPMVTLLPTVTEEMLIGTVPEIDAVTEPIWAVPAAIVTVPPPIVTTPIGFVPAGRAEPIVTVPEMGLLIESTTTVPD